MAAVYTVLGLALWPVPVLGLVHVESAALVAGVATIASALATVSSVRERRPVEALPGGWGGLLGLVFRAWGLLLIPLVLLSVTLLWRPNCAYLAGAGFFLLFTLPSAALGVAVANLAISAGVKRPRLWIFLWWGGVVMVVPLLVLKTHPQFFVYSVAFGGVLGPIYDEELALRPGLFAHRAVTVGWALWATATAVWCRGGLGRAGRLVWGGLTLGIGVSYLFSVQFGITQSEANLARSLGASRVSEGFVLHYRPGSVPEARLREIETVQQYRLARLKAELGVSPRETIHVFLYPSEEEKGYLTGARRTSIAPVWLARPQLHLLEESFEHTFGHELAHVVAREFGVPVLGASWSVGLVEGVAVAMEPPDGLPPPQEQVAASVQARGVMADPAAAVATVMDPIRFWTSRAGVAYTGTGAFIRYLLDRYGAASLREVYRTADFEAVYGRSLSVLTREWAQTLNEVPVTPSAKALAAWRFGQPSLFEVRCPHHVPHWRRHAREARAAWSDERVEVARDRWAEALRKAPTQDAVRVRWGAVALAGGTSPSAVLDSLAAPRDSLEEAGRLRVLGDAHLLLGDRGRARELYAQAAAALPPYATLGAALTRLRGELSPRALRVVLAPSETAEMQVRQARRLGMEDPTQAVFSAALWSRASQYGQALNALHRGRTIWAELPSAEAAAVRAWKAQLAVRAGVMSVAEQEARTVEAAARAAGQTGRALLMQDVRTRAAWERARAPALP